VISSTKLSANAGAASEPAIATIIIPPRTPDFDEFICLARKVSLDAASILLKDQRNDAKTFTILLTLRGQS
jgi:hypothetical protein